MDNNTERIRELNISDNMIFLDGKLLKNVKSYSIEADSGNINFEARGAVEDSNGDPVVFFGDIVEYHIKEKVKLVFMDEDLEKLNNG